MRIIDRRIGRLGFLLGYLILLAVASVFVSTLPEHSGSFGEDPTRLFIWLALLAWSILLAAWRCHDFNQSAWSNFWTEQLPLIGPFLALWDLLTKPGDPYVNSYGPPPWF